MMDLTFVKDTIPVVLRVIGKNVYFAKLEGGVAKYTPIEGLQLNPAGIVKEFPDLKGKPIPEIKREGINRFKEHIQKLNSLTEIKDYLQKDLEKHGYKLIMFQQKGHRPKKVI